MIFRVSSSLEETKCCQCAVVMIQWMFCLAARALLLFSTVTPGNTIYIQRSIMAPIDTAVCLWQDRDFLFDVSRKQSATQHVVFCSSLCGETIMCLDIQCWLLCEIWSDLLEETIGSLHWFDSKCLISNSTEQGWQWVSSGQSKSQFLPFVKHMEGISILKCMFYSPRFLKFF